MALVGSSLFKRHTLGVAAQKTEQDGQVTTRRLETEHLVPSGLIVVNHHLGLHGLDHLGLHGLVAVRDTFAVDYLHLNVGVTALSVFNPFTILE